MVGGEKVINTLSYPLIKQLCRVPHTTVDTKKHAATIR